MTRSLEDLMLRFDLQDATGVDLRPNYNTAPGQDIAVVHVEHGSRVLDMMRWGLIPSWAKDPAVGFRMINARSETAAEKPSFRSVWKHGRCLVPAGGYYEWTGEKGYRRPNVILPAGNADTLWFAGLASRWQGLLTCTIMTRPATEEMAALHPRMPVILNAEQRDAWLGGSNDTGLGAGVPLRHYPVAPFGIADDGPELIEPIGDA